MRPDYYFCLVVRLDDVFSIAASSFLRGKLHILSAIIALVELKIPGRTKLNLVKDSAGSG